MDERFTELATQLADLLIEREGKELSSEEERERYAQQVRKKAVGSMGRFQERFKRGYHLLIDQLSKKPTEGD